MSGVVFSCLLLAVKHNQLFEASEKSEGCQMSIFPASRDNFLTLKSNLCKLLLTCDREFFFHGKLLRSPSKSLLTVNSC